MTTEKQFTPIRLYGRVDAVHKTITPPTTDTQWHIVNFTIEEFITFTTTSSTYSNYMSMFEYVDDEDEVSRWNTEDDIRWVSEDDKNTIDCFSDVFGYRKYDHKTGVHDKTTFTTKECKKEYQDYIDEFKRSVRRLSRSK